MSPQVPTLRARRPRRVAVAALLIAAGFLLVGFPSVGAPAAPLTNGASTPSSRPFVVAPAFVPGPGVVDLGRLPNQTMVRAIIGLAPSNSSALEARLALQYTPGTPEYGQRMTAAEIAATYGPTEASYARATSYFSGRGLSVVTSPDQWMLTVSGPAQRVAAAFGTSFERYATDGRTFFSHPTAATLPAGLPWSGALGLGNETVIRPAVAGLPPPTPPRGTAASTCSNANGLAPCAIWGAYNVTPLLNNGDNGSGERIGIVDAYDASETQTSLASDFATFTSSYSLPAKRVSYLYPIPTNHNLNATYTGWGTEEALDLEWVRASAPGASIDMTFAPDPTAGLYASVDWLVAHQSVDVLSLSWGEPDVGVYNSFLQSCSFACNATTDGSYSLLHPVLVAAALEGISVLVASGDCGAADGTNGVATNYPASDPAATGVGGTYLSVSGTSYVSESGWSGNSSGAQVPGCSNAGGSGGGYSPFPRPAWQQAPGFASRITQRGVPDVAADASDLVAYVIGGSHAEQGGTSLATPLWAGWAAIADQIHGSALGFLNPSLYQLARGSRAAQLFHDVKSGNNGYAAASGWDPVTGIGTPIANALLPALGVGTPSLTGLFADLSVSPRAGPAPLAATINGTAYGAGSPILAYDLDFGDGNATWTATGSASHTYLRTGVFLARSVVFLADGNSSVSLPVAVVVGGGGGLNVSLNASTTAPLPGAPDRFTANVSGGTAPYHLAFSFGDGTYAVNGSSFSVSHAYFLTGPDCVNVVAWDSATPVDGAASTRLAIAVGGGGPADCHNPTALHAAFSIPLNATDLPGDVPLVVAAAGGTPPYTTRFLTDDTYVNACQCGIFRVPGRHTVLAFTNDSLLGSVENAFNVTLYPALSASFGATSLTGTAPWSVTFTAQASGGHLADANATNWTFGDGTNATAAGVTHTFTTPGLYVVTALLRDHGNGSASSVFLVDALPPTAPGSLGLTATITPGPAAPAGSLLTFSAAASGGAGAYTYRWDLGDGDSAFGPSVQQTYTPTGCLANGTCPLNVSVTVTDAQGTNLTADLPLAPAVARSASALTLTDSFGPSAGATPLSVGGNASARGMTGVSASWLYGDGGSSAGLIPSHTYLLPGNYTATLTVSDAWGDRLVRTHAVDVTGLARIRPTVSGGITSPPGVAPLNVTFDVGGVGGGGAPYAYAWAFGDGSTGAGSPVAHTYGRVGNFTATVTVADALGTTATASYAVRVFNTTLVALALAVPTAPVPLGTPFVVELSAAPGCTGESLPGCAPNAFRIQLSMTGDGVQTVVPSAAGNANVTFPGLANRTGGVVSAIVLGPGYQGVDSVRVNVAPAVAAPNMASDPLVWAALLAAVAGAVGLGYVVLRRRRRSINP